MASKAIECIGLSKRYRISQGARYRTIRESLSNAAASAIGRADRRSDHELWALRDVSFAVERGEVLGIIGRNGTGKSTLLKILSRITRPTAGRGVVNGRVGSLLEVGTGFHQELTGRENIFLNGAILGMTRREIRQRFDAIVAFAEVERFLDLPVKRYSSGMYMRLAFAVAAHLDSEILLVDEVLAVGDAAFQKKCLGAVAKIASGGRTVLMVSHNLVAVEGLCSRALCLEDGRVGREGEVRDVISYYLRSGMRAMVEQVWEDRDRAPGNEQARLRRVAVRADGPRAGGIVSVATPIVVELEFWNQSERSLLNVAIWVYNESGVLLFSSADTIEEQLTRGLFRTECRIPGDLLNDGRHFVTVGIVKNQGTLLFQEENAVAFDVHDAPHLRGAWYGKWEGAVRPAIEWKPPRLVLDEPALQELSAC
jgi:lipopolysaccharide transport system ATP-binding protein